MKVQTRGLLADLSTMKPPGPFSPLREKHHRRGSWGDTLEPGKASDLTPHSILGPSWTWGERGKGTTGLATATLPEQGPEQVSQRLQDTALHPPRDVACRILLRPADVVHPVAAIILSVQGFSVSSGWGGGGLLCLHLSPLPNSVRTTVVPGGGAREGVPSQVVGRTSPVTRQLPYSSTDNSRAHSTHKEVSTQRGNTRVHHPGVCCAESLIPPTGLSVGAQEGWGEWESGRPPAACGSKVRQQEN